MGVYAERERLESARGKLVASDAIGSAYQGCSVAISADGNTAIVGGYFDDGGQGAAWVYTRSNGVWTPQAGKLIGAGNVKTAGQGYSVALSADATTVLLGGPYDNQELGAVWAFAYTSDPTIASTGVVNGASFLPGIAPGTWITIRGANLASTTRNWTASDFSGNNLRTQLDGVSVTVNNKPAYVAYVSPTQLNVLTPDDTPGVSAPVQVLPGQGTSNVVTAAEASFSPALFTFEGRSYVAAVRSDGTYIGPANLISGVLTVPAKPGDTILLFGTGFGPTTPPSTVGQLNTAALLANPVTITIGGVPANTLFAGIIGPGLYQFNVTVPNLSSNGDNPVVVMIGMDGPASQANAFVTVER